MDMSCRKSRKADSWFPIAGSFTRVGDMRMVTTAHDRRVLNGPLARQVHQAVALLRNRRAVSGAPEPPVDPVSTTYPQSNRVVAALLEPGRERLARELCSSAARLAADVGGRVVALTRSADDAEDVGVWGADEAVVLTGDGDEEDVARSAGDWAMAEAPWAILAPGTL